MKIKIVFLISAMNALSYSCYGDYCGDCCNCWDNCGEEGFGKENIKEKFFIEEKNTDEEIKKEKIKNFVNEKWLKKGEDNVKFKIYEEKKEGKIKVTKYKNGEIKVEKFSPEINTQKWALFEIKYKKEGEKEDKFVYLYCNDIESVGISGMFKEKENILNISVLACDTSEVKDMSCMFYKCFNLGDLDLSKFDTKTVTNMQRMFEFCSSLKNLDLSNFNTSKVTDMFCMFNSCSNLENLDLSNFNTSKINHMDYMFDVCKKLNKVTVSKEGDTKNAIFAKLNEEVGKWKEEKNIEENICTLIKVEEKK